MLMRALGVAAALLALPAAAAPRVATDIAPVQSIAARVMGDLGAPGLILPPGASPHDHALRPSEARLLQEAEVVVWVGPPLTPWLADPLAALAPDAVRVTLAEAPGMTLLPIRVGGPFVAHDHAHGDEHAGDDAADGHADDQDHDHEAAEPGAGVDGHLWLDPENAIAAAGAIAVALGAADPANAAAYAANADSFAREMRALEAEIAAELAPVRGRPFLVFHDAYQYFEHRFAIPAAGSVALHDGMAPGTARVAGLRGRVAAEGIVCAFTEPQFEPKLLATVIEGSGIRTGVLDHIGTEVAPGPDLYPAMMRNLAASLVACLGG